MKNKLDSLNPNSSHSKKAIVFGGSGFLGSHVAEVLTNNGYDVAIFDLVDSPYKKSSQLMIVGDILEQEKVREAVKGYDYVYNFAGISE